MDQFFVPVLSQTVNPFLLSLTAFAPRLLVALVVLFVGIIIAKSVRSILIKFLERLKLSHSLENTPLMSFVKNADVTNTIESVIGKTAYWLIMLVVIEIVVSLLGITAAADLLNKILSFVPNVFSAIFILFLGTFLAGIAESVVKGAVRTIDGHSSLFLGKATSYLILILATMIAISELGIAAQFITTLFTGFVIALALAFGLAFGLGSKDTVNRLMTDWYDRMKREEK
ncbi:MAG TPA: hypothetical protein VLH19_00190 [Patescibacteria group bacterium]|nr:hypothetical protein [Patescibacteria group bacterium]